MADLAEENARLMRQAEYFASDDRIREAVEVWRDTTVEHRLGEVAEMCAAGDYFLSRLEPDVLERVLRPLPLPEDTLELLARLRRTAR